MSTRPPSGRERDLQRIRSAYEQYRRKDRKRIWDTANRGFARLVADRDHTIVQLVRAHLRAANAVVVDLGFGDARLALAVSAAAVPLCHWVGVDLDSEAVKAATVEVPWASFIEASADALPFDDESVDLILASALFSSLPSQELERSVAAEIGRVLQPGGALIWYDLRYDNPLNSNVHGVSKRRLASLFPGWSSHLRTTSLIPPVARRLGALTPVLYPMLEAAPALRSHLVGSLHRP